MNPVEVRVNVINQLKLLRQSTFKDKLSFLDEDVQNAQRAKATEVRVSVEYSDKRVTIENNGKVLNNPQSLFSIAESEWDEDVQNTENPFGMGFFSNITVSDYIEIFSGNKHIIFNVKDMIENNRTQIEVKETETNYDGFKLVLNNFDFNEVYSRDIKERVELLGRYIHELDIYYNGELQEKKDLSEGDGSVFIKKIENDETFKGWIALSKGFSQDLRIFYKGRLVTKLDSMYHVKGDIHISDKTLNLTSPDRKDIIRDNKYCEFVSLIELYFEELANDSFMNGSQINIEQHIESISYYANKNALKNEISFLVFDVNDKNDSEYLKGVALAKRDNNEIKTMNQYEVFLKSNAAKQSTDEINIQENVKNMAPMAEGIRYYAGDSGTSGSTEEPQIDDHLLVERKGSKINFYEEPVFWLGFDEIVEHEHRFNIAKHYGLKIIVSRNKFESNILEMLGHEQNIVHISKLTEKSKIKATISNTALSAKEQRALMLLDMISRIVGFDDNVFGIGDVMVVKQTTIEALEKTVEKIEEDFIAVCDSVSNKVYIDRTTIEKSKLRDDLNEELDLEDYKFILLNLKQIIDEICLINFDFGGKDGLYERIINTLAVV